MCEEIPLDIQSVKDYFSAMRQVYEWCGVCLQDDLKVIADQVIEQVPLCKGCVVAYRQESDVLRDARQFLRDMEDDDPKKTSGYEVFDPDQSAPPPIKHLCVCGCGKEVLEGTRLIAGHIDPTVAPAPPSNRREPDKPLTTKQRQELLSPKKLVAQRSKKNMPDDRIITDEEVERGLKMIEEGLTVADIARNFGYTYGHVSHHLKRAQRGFLPSGERSPRKQSATVEAESSKQIVRQTRRKEVHAVEVESHEVESWATGQERISKLHIELPSGGKLSLELDCHLFEISAEDRSFVFAISDRMRSYAKQKSVPLPYKNFSIIGVPDGNFVIDMLDMMDQEEQNRVVEWVKDAVEAVKKRK